MPGPNTPITEREKNAIFAYVYGLLPDLKTAFICAYDGEINQAEGLKALNSQVSRWSRSDKFMKYADYCKRIIADKDSDARQRGREEERSATAVDSPGDSNRTKPTKPGKVDYYNPENQRRTINAIIDKAQDDPKTQLDAIKAIQQTQRDDRQAAKDNQIQRFFTPVTCKICPLYQKRTKKG